MEKEKRRCPKCGGEMTRISLLRFRGPPDSPTIEKSPPIEYRCRKCGYSEGGVLGVKVEPKKTALPDSQERFSLLEIHDEDCPKGEKHKLKTEEDVAWCEKCGNRWCLR